MKAVLQDQEWEFLINMVYRLYSLSDIAQFQKICLEQLRVLIPNTRGLFLLDDRDESKIVSHSPIRISTDHSTFNESFFKNHIVRRTCQEYYYKQESHAFRITDVIGNEEWSQMLLCRSIYEPLNIFYALKIVLIYNDNLLGDISLYRQKDEEDFSLRDLRIATLVKDCLAMKLFDLRQEAQRQENDDLQQRRCFNYHFTDREAQIIELIRAGQTDKEICEQLCISLYTLKNHIHNIYHKTGAKNRVQIVLLTLQNHIKKEEPRDVKLRAEK